MVDCLALWRAVLAVAFIATTASAQEYDCDLSEFDKGEPKHISDTTPATGHSALEWGADADPFNGQSRSWHYVKNLHENPVSLTWNKVGLTVPFTRPLPTQQVVCVKHYGGKFVADSHASISISNDGDKSTIAFVEPDEAATIRGADVQTKYADSEGALRTAAASFKVEFVETSIVLQIATAEDTSLAFSPDLLGIDGKAFIEAIAEMGTKVSAYASFSELFKPEAWPAMSKVEQSQLFAVVSMPSSARLTFPIVAAQSPTAPILLLGRDGEPVVSVIVRLQGAKR